MNPTDEQTRLLADALVEGAMSHAHAQDAATLSMRDDAIRPVALQWLQTGSWPDEPRFGSTTPRSLAAQHPAASVLLELTHLHAEAVHGPLVGVLGDAVGGGVRDDLAVDATATARAQQAMERFQQPGWHDVEPLEAKRATPDWTGPRAHPTAIKRRGARRRVDVANHAEALRVAALLATVVAVAAAGVDLTIVLPIAVLGFVLIFARVRLQ